MVNMMHRHGCAKRAGATWVEKGGGSVPGLHYHRRSSGRHSQTGPEEIHPLTTQERTETKKVRTTHEERKRVRSSHRHIDPRSTLSSCYDPLAISSAPPSR